MGKQLVVIMDPDASFVGPLEVTFLEKLRDVIELEVITDSIYRDAFLARPHDIEALLVAECWCSEAVLQQNAAKTFILTESPVGDATGSFLVEHVYKYVNTTSILGKVKSACPGLYREEDEGESRVLLFHSPVGGAGTTTAAIAVAACLQDEYKRVLYVNAEHVQSFRCFMRDGKTASNAMAREMTSPAPSLFARMLHYIESDGFDYLPPLAMGIHSFGVPFSFFAQFIEEARDSGRYDYIVVDTDSAFDEGKVGLLRLADKVFVCVTQDEKALFKTVCFLRNLDVKAEDKFVFVCNKHREGERNAFMEAGAGAAVVIDCHIGYDAKVADMKAPHLSKVEEFAQLVEAVL